MSERPAKSKSEKSKDEAGLPVLPLADFRCAEIEQNLRAYLIHPLSFTTIVPTTSVVLPSAEAFLDVVLLKGPENGVLISLFTVTTRPVTKYYFYHNDSGILFIYTHKNDVQCPRCTSTNMLLITRDGVKKMECERCGNIIASIDMEKDVTWRRVRP